MQTIRFYGYDKCSTCRRARKWLEKRGHVLEVIDITQRPPSAQTLRAILAGGEYQLKQLLNTSGGLYRQMNLKEKLAAMNESQVLALLAEHGKLIKRPIVTDGRRSTVGFAEPRFEQVWAGAE